MKKAPDNYNTDQIFNDILFLATRLKALEDRVDDIACGFVDIAIEFYTLCRTLDKTGGQLVRVIFHPDCTIEQRERTLYKIKNLPPLLQSKALHTLKREVRETRELIDGLQAHYTQETLPILSEINKDKTKVDKQDYL